MSTLPYHGSADTGRQAIAQLMSAYTGVQALPEHLQMVAEGASGRCIMRSGQEACCGIIGIYWTPARADNAAFIPAARCLKKAGVNVPAILAELDCGDGCGACLAQDLGTCSLLSLRSAPWDSLRTAYRAALRELAKLHRVHADYELQPPFDAGLYCWEQDYFAEHLLGRHLGLDDARSMMRKAGGTELADWLSRLPRALVHRDCQSQNIILCDDQAFFIDFQGMRPGRPEYDLASLLYDPYMELAPEHRAELLEHYQALTPEPIEADIYYACALQRIMQALGAFANIGYNQGNSWYLQLIPAGLRTLRQICAATPANSPATPLATCLCSVIRSR